MLIVIETFVRRPNNKDSNYLFTREEFAMMVRPQKK